MILCGFYIYMCYSSQRFKETTFTKVEGEFEQFFFIFFIIQMADDINHAADNNTNSLKRLPVLVRILFKFSSWIIIQRYFLSRYYEDYYIYPFGKQNFFVFSTSNQEFKDIITSIYSC